MSSVVFDRVAHRYDATRGHSDEVAQRMLQQIDQASGGNAQARFLEIGVGTGRFALPLTAQGRQYTGIDVSEKMVEQLVRKLDEVSWQKEELAWGSLPDEESAHHPHVSDVQRFLHRETQGRLRIVMADATDLPFTDQTFDALVAVHVFHLIVDWQKALEELLRVVRPGGVLVRCWTENRLEQWKPGLRDVRNRWCQIVQELGGNTDVPGTGDDEVTAWLQQHGLETVQTDVVTWEYQITPRKIFEGVEQRIWTSTLVVPDDMFATSIQHLRTWMDEHYGDAIDQPYTQQGRMLINVTRIPA